MDVWQRMQAPVWTVGAPVALPMLVRAVPTVDDILMSLQRAQHDLSLQCAVASLGRFIPDLRGRPGYADLHRENYEVSYHLTTAMGAARRILAGSRDPGYFALLVTCQRAAQEHQQRAIAAYRRMTGAVPAAAAAELRPLLQRLGGHLQATAGHLERGMGLTTAALGPETITRLVRWTEAAEQR